MSTGAAEQLGDITLINAPDMTGVYLRGSFVWEEEGKARATQGIDTDC